MTRLAARLIRRRWARLLFLSACLAAGSAFLAAGDILLAALGGAVASRARDILGADLELSSARPFGPAVDAALAGLTAGGARATSVTAFSTMLSAEGPAGVPRLASVRAVEPGYPLRGTVDTEPPGAIARLFTGDACLLDAAAARQHGAKPGSRVRLGALTLTVAGVVTRESGRTLNRFQLAPRVYMARALVERSGLARFGARIKHERLIALPPSREPESAARAAAAGLEARLADPYLSVTAFSDAEPTTRQALGRLTNYFTMVSLVTFLLGAGAMASGLAAFLDEELETAAVLRCLGLTGPQTRSLYRTLCLFVGLQAGVLGALGGWALAAAALAFLRRGFGLELPASAGLDPRAAAEAVLLAAACAWAVSEAKVRALAGVPPLEVLRERAERLPPTPRGTAALLAAAAAAVYAYVLWKTSSADTARWFTAAVTGTSAALTLGCLASLRAVAAAARRPGLPLAVRLGLISLARRPARSLPFLFTLAAGFGLLGALDLVRHSLAKELAAGRAAERPELFLVDVQRAQLDAVRGLARRWGRGEPAFAPLIRARLAAVNGVAPARRPVDGLGQEGRARQRMLLREFNLTYADALNPSETLRAGAFWGPGEQAGLASLEEGFAKRTGLKLGDRLVFDVQGRPVSAVVASLRAVDWLAMRPNFFVVLPTAVLEKAPQHHIGSLTVRDPVRSAASTASEAALPRDSARSDAFRRALAEAAPNVSVIDAGEALDQVSEVLAVLLAALKGLAWFCVAVGLLVLAGALALGSRERRADAALLRALGAGTRLLVGADSTAFAAAGLSTFVLGAGAAYGLGALLAARLDVAFAPDAPGLAALLASALLLPPAVGLGASAPAYRAAPLETLRREE
ncbi:MAG: hypothetical protein HYZ75_02145 [Elusimicrobia bacterium]|nr:hypothetical protein [Elusimicrobiota bacterium]